MIHGFDCPEEPAAVAALLVYACWRSRDRRVLKITPEVWSQVERFAKAAAKRAQTLPAWLEAFKPRVGCGALDPRYLRSDLVTPGAMLVRRDPETGALRDLVERGGAGREFLTGVLGQADAVAVLARLYRETGWVVLLVRERLERERPYETLLGEGSVEQVEQVA